MTRNSDDRIPDPERSAAVLIGGNSYPNLPSLPSARTSVTELKDVLTDRDIWGLPPSRCLVVPDPESAAEIIDPVAEAGALASDMLFVYFSGHGLLDSDHELHLAVSGTERERPFTALAYRYLRATILAAAARRTVVVLDCCYSGNVLGTMGDHDAVFAESARADEIRGVCVITASAEFQQALAPEDDRFTAFSGEFIRVLRHGDPGPRPVLDLNSVCRGRAVQAVVLVAWGSRCRRFESGRPDAGQRAHPEIGSALWPFWGPRSVKLELAWRCLTVGQASATSAVDCRVLFLLYQGGPQAGRAGPTPACWRPPAGIGRAGRPNLGTTRSEDLGAPPESRPSSEIGREQITSSGKGYQPLRTGPRSFGW
ncbi:caspase family protein [Micromonospora luteifusca]|uniref:caspase family protein n=1 Tax=Micromonospora luteifusca TaxID=709860 RepID=UPI0033AF0D1D